MRAAARQIQFRDSSAAARGQDRAVRLQRFLADAGVASRRAAEQLIRNGHVSVNGSPVTLLGSKICPARDQVLVDGRPVRVRRRIYVALHKPKGYLSTRTDPRGRPTVIGLLPPELRHLYPVGRLDCGSEGLLFLTNDGDFALRLTHPRYGSRKFYRAHVRGTVDPGMLRRIERGVIDQGERLQAERAKIVSAKGANSVVELELREGKNREIRRLFASQGVQVTRLQRIAIGPVGLGSLARGRWRTLTEAEIDSLIQAL